MVGKSNDYDGLVSFDGYEREGESMKNKLFRPGFCGVAGDRNQRGIWFLKQLYCLFKSIDQALSKPYFFLVIPRSGFFQFRSSFPADSYSQYFSP